jgi:hypothetical protein
VLSAKAASAPAAPPADTASVARSSGAGTPGQRPPEGVRASSDTAPAGEGRRRPPAIGGDPRRAGLPENSPTARPGSKTR